MFECLPRFGNDDTPQGTSRVVEIDGRAFLEVLQELLQGIMQETEDSKARWNSLFEMIVALGERLVVVEHKLSQMTPPDDEEDLA